MTNTPGPANTLLTARPVTANFFFLKVKIYLETLLYSRSRLTAFLKLKRISVSYYSEAGRVYFYCKAFLRLPLRATDSVRAASPTQKLG